MLRNLNISNEFFVHFNFKREQCTQMTPYLSLKKSNLLGVIFAKVRDITTLLLLC